MDKIKTVNSQIRIPKETWLELKKIALKEKRSINAQLIYIIEKFIKEETKEEK